MFDRESSELSGLPYKRGQSLTLNTNDPNPQGQARPLPLQETHLNLAGDNTLIPD